MDEKVFYIDDEHYFPEYFLEILHVLGIDEGYGLGNFFYESKELKVRYRNNGIVWYTNDNAYLAHINLVTNTLFFGNGEKGDTEVSVKIGDGYAAYSYGNKKYTLDIRGDMLGEVHVVFEGPGRITESTGSLSIKEEEVITIGEDKFEPHSYFDLIRNRIVDKVDPDDLEMIDVIFSNPIIVDRLEKLLNDVSDTIDDAYLKKIKEISEFYQGQINEAVEKILETQKGAIADLTAYKDRCLIERGLKNSEEKRTR
jgi:hypothetical protein